MHRSAVSLFLQTNEANLKCEIGISTGKKGHLSNLQFTKLARKKSFIFIMFDFFFFQSLDAVQKKYF